MVCRIENRALFPRAVRFAVLGPAGIALLLGCANGSVPYEPGASATAPSAEQPEDELPPVELPWLHVQDSEIKNELGETVVLRGVSTVDLGVTDTYPGGAIGMIDRLTSKADHQGNSPGWYTSVIRLAIYPADSTETRSPFTYSAANDYFYEQLLRPVVDRCRQRGAYAIIDWHYIGDTNLHRQTTAEFWADMAPRFANDSHVLFELFNEPVNRAGGWQSVKQDMQAWYDIVRAAAPDNLVLVGTPEWCQRLADTATDPIRGTNVAYVSHVYPMHFPWDYVKEGIKSAKAAHPVFMTEWGFQADASSSIVQGNATNYGTPFRQFVDDLGLSWTAWCASHNWYPSMFSSDFTLLVGENYMGGFAKDWIYDLRSVGAPIPPSE